jgi:hypothetical protein
MKNIILLAILVTFCNFSYSQKNANKPTRQQTETWLSEKISKYIHKEDYYSIDDNILMKVTTGNKKNINLRLTYESIIITYDVEEYISNKYEKVFGIENKTRNYSVSVTIKLKDITNKVFIKEGYLVFQSNYKSFVTTNSDGFKNTSNWYGVKIDAYEEEDLTVRFNKAMNYLLTFVKKSKPSEIF